MGHLKLCAAIGPTTAETARTFSSERPTSCPTNTAPSRWSPRARESQEAGQRLLPRPRPIAVASCCKTNWGVSPTSTQVAVYRNADAEAIPEGVVARLSRGHGRLDHADRVQPITERLSVPCSLNLPAPSIGHRTTKLASHQSGDHLHRIASWAGTSRRKRRRLHVGRPRRGRSSRVPRRVGRGLCRVGSAIAGSATPRHRWGCASQARLTHPTKRRPKPGNGITSLSIGKGMSEHGIDFEPLENRRAPKGAKSGSRRRCSRASGKRK